MRSTRAMTDSEVAVATPAVDVDEGGALGLRPDLGDFGDLGAFGAAGASGMAPDLAGRRAVRRVGLTGLTPSPVKSLEW